MAHSYASIHCGVLGVKKQLQVKLNIISFILLRISRMSDAASKDLRGTIYDLIGYDQVTKKVKNYFIAQYC